MVSFHNESIDSFLYLLILFINRTTEKDKELLSVFLGFFEFICEVYG